MALSTKKINLIIADWKTGKFSSYYAIAKHHKISQPKAKEILVNIDHSNADIVEAGVKYETAKKLSKNLVEVKAIEKAVLDRVKIDNITNKILDGVEGLLTKGTKQIVVKVKEYNKEGGNSESLDVVNVELDTNDYKNMQDTVDKASVTSNINQRHAPRAVTALQINTEEREVKQGIGELYKVMKN